jgi:hypothetical protein
MTAGYGNSRQHADRYNVVTLPTEDLAVAEPFARLAPSHEPPLGQNAEASVSPARLVVPAFPSLIDVTELSIGRSLKP